MAQHPKPSRNERQIRNQSRGLFWVSAALLLACMTMTGMFGASLGRTIVEKAAYAVGLCGMDLAGALLVSFSGVCFANKERGAATAIFLAALVVFAVTLLGMIGFQSETREAVAQSREQASKIANTWIEFTTSATLRALPQGKSKEQPQAFAVGVESVAKAAKDQIAMLGSGELNPVADGQATTISRMTGVQEATARSWSISGMSGALLFAQYVCLWCYGFARHRIEPKIAAQNVVGMTQFAGDKTTKSANDLAFSDDDARKDLDLLLSGGFRIDRYGAYSILARRYSWTPHKTRRWLERQPDLAVPPKRPRRSVQSVDNRTPALNGNGRAHMA